MPAGMIIKSPASTSIRIQRSCPLCLIKAQIPSVNLFDYTRKFFAGVIFFQCLYLSPLQPLNMMSKAIPPYRITMKMFRAL
jgi:hypothetical protein